MDASVVITTKNRKKELRIALHSAVRQSSQPEVVVIDDGSTDGTAEMVRQEFPQAVFRRFEESKGLIVRRNEAARLATGDIIFSIDDDAEFSTPNVIEQTLSEFSIPRIGAVAILYIEPHKTNHLLQKAPDNKSVWITGHFIGTAHAVRRDVFLKLGRYREHLVHQGEEVDFCIRMLAAGFLVRLGDSDPIHHFESPKRDLRRMDFYGSRNPILFAWENVPMPYLPFHAAATTFNCLRWTLHPSRFLVRLRGVLAGYADCVRIRHSPVPRHVYRQWRRLRKAKATRLQEVSWAKSQDSE